MTVAELYTKPRLEVRGLKMVTDLTRTMRPRRGETHRRSHLALGRGYRRDPGCEPNSAGLPVLSTFPSLIRVASAEWLERGTLTRSRRLG